ncbi:MAG: sulfotransferase [Burkholderiales bacterium]
MSPADLDGWVPAHLYRHQGRMMAEWYRTGSERFHEPFFEESVGRLLRYPFNSLFFKQTPASVLGELAAHPPAVKPAGFIFHTSRCGSTLVAQMLASSARNIVISEAPAFDTILRERYAEGGASETDRTQWLQGLMAALGQRRHSEEDRLFVKFDSWSIFELPIIQRAFPAVPWIFLYRNPIEVLVSHMRRRGVQMVPGMLPPEMFGLDRDDAVQMQAEEFCARALRALLESALRNLGVGHGLLVNYADLPGSMWSEILAHFGVSWSEIERKSMAAAAQLDAKNPIQAFNPDAATKLSAAGAQLAIENEKHSLPVYEQLEAVRLAARSK